MKKRLSFLISLILTAMILASCNHSPAAPTIQATPDTKAPISGVYADIPDSMFPIPMLNGAEIPYDEVTTSETYNEETRKWNKEIFYSYKDIDFMKSYQEQLKEAGFVEAENTEQHESIWSYDRSDDGATLVVTMYQAYRFNLFMRVYYYEPSEITKENPLSVAEVKGLISTHYGTYELTYVPEMDRQNGGIQSYCFMVDYSYNGKPSPPAYGFCYAWVDSVTGHVEFEEVGPDLYSNVPDSMFPVPARDGIAIPYDDFSPPGYGQGLSYVYCDTSVVQLYEEQLRQAGFVNGYVIGIDSYWTYERDEDDTLFMVSMYISEESCSVSMSVH